MQVPADDAKRLFFCMTKEALSKSRQAMFIRLAPPG